MKYFTKEWYLLCQNTGLHFGLRTHKEAVEYSETLYQRLKKRKLKAFVQLEQAIHDKPLPFDTQQCQCDFEKYHLLIIEEHQRRIPKIFQEQIADIRVFALGYCTKEMRMALKSLSEANRKQVEVTIDAYRASAHHKTIPEGLEAKLNFHDSQIIEVTISEDIRLNLSDFNEVDSLYEIVFKNAKVLNQETALVGSYWLYKEIYPVSGGYEVHLLVSDERQLSAEFTVWCECFEVTSKF